MSISVGSVPGITGPVGSAYTQTYSTATRTHAKSELSEAVSATLIAELVTQLNTTNAAVNELKKLSNGVIDDLQTASVLK